MSKGLTVIYSEVVLEYLFNYYYYYYSSFIIMIKLTLIKSSNALSNTLDGNLI